MTGQEIGNYVLEAELGRGGMGEVYLGRHKSLGTRAAIKVMSAAMANEEQFRERFTREARTQAQLRHPHIAQVLDHVEQGGRWFLVVEYMENGTLEDVIEKTRGPIVPHQALAWARQALLGLDHAHSKGVIHRDVKPANILLNERGEAAVTDFGIALEVGRQRLTRTGVSIGTPEYMSPEQIRGATDLDHRTDVYSMGVVLYELLAGRAPFESSSTFEVQRAQVSEPPPPLTQVNPEVPPQLEGLVMRALAKTPADRYSTCGEFAEALAAYERGEPVAAPPPIQRRTVLESAEAPMFPPPAPASDASTRAPTVMADTGMRSTPPPPPPGKKSAAPAWIATMVLAAALAGGVFWVTWPNEKPGDGSGSPAVAAIQRAQEESGKAQQADAAAQAAARQAAEAAAQAEAEAGKAEGSRRPAEAQAAAGSAERAAGTARQAATTAELEAGKAEQAALASETAASEAAASEAAATASAEPRGEPRFRFAPVAAAYADDDPDVLEARQAADTARGAADSARQAAADARSSADRADRAAGQARQAVARLEQLAPPPPISLPPPPPPPPPPAPRLPPLPDQPVVAVLATGDPLMAAPLEMEMERRLLRAGFDVRDEHNSMRFNEVLDSRGGAVTATELMPVLLEDGYHVLVLLRVDVGGSRTLNVRGQTMTLSSARLGMNAHLMPGQRSIGRGWAEQTEYTELSAPAKAEKAFLGATADLAEAIENDWAAFLRELGR